MRRLSRLGAVAATVLGFVVSGPAWCDQWSGYLTPVGAHVEDDNNTPYFFVMTAQAILNPANCPSTDGYEASDQVIMSSMLATVLAAMGSGQQISIFVSSSHCVNGRPDAEVVEIGQN